MKSKCMQSDEGSVGYVRWLRKDALPQQDVIPEATCPVYTTERVSAPVPLWSGAVELTQGNQVSRGRAVVRMVWPPRPDVAFDVRLRGCPVPPELGPVEIRIPSLQTTAKATVDEVHMSASVGRKPSPPRLVCSLSGDMEIGSGRDLSCVLFHLPNFRHFIGLPARHGEYTSASRAVLQAAGWRVLLDQVHSLNAKLLEELQQARGHAITHVGRVERASGQTLDAEVLPDFMNALTYFLSFCQGNWVSPMLYVGLDATGNRVWERWGSRRVERWAGVHSWFSEFKVEGLSGAFPGFIRRWQDKLWQDPLRLAMHWYVESNRCSGGVEGALVLAQVALEFLYGPLLAQAGEAGAGSIPDGAPAGDRVRALLRMSKLDPGIPDSLTGLAEFSRSHGCLDGPTAITRVRNAWVHPKQTEEKSRIREDTRLAHQAWRLALWYLELALLSVFDYHGEYSNRLSTARWQGAEVELVPWATAPS